MQFGFRRFEATLVERESGGGRPAAYVVRRRQGRNQTLPVGSVTKSLSSAILDLLSQRSPVRSADMRTVFGEWGVWLPSQEWASLLRPFTKHTPPQSRDGASTVPHSRQSGASSSRGSVEVDGRAFLRAYDVAVHRLLTAPLPSDRDLDRVVAHGGGRRGDNARDRRSHSRSIDERAERRRGDRRGPRGSRGSDGGRARGTEAGSSNESAVPYGKKETWIAPKLLRARLRAVSMDRGGYGWCRDRGGRWHMVMVVQSEALNMSIEAMGRCVGRCTTCLVHHCILHSKPVRDIRSFALSFLLYHPLPLCPACSPGRYALAIGRHFPGSGCGPIENCDVTRI